MKTELFGKVSTHLFKPDTSSTGVVNEPWYMARPNRFQWVRRVEDKLGQCKIIWHVGLKTRSIDLRQKDRKSATKLGEEKDVGFAWNQSGGYMYHPGGSGMRIGGLGTNHLTLIGYCSNAGETARTISTAS